MGVIISTLLIQFYGWTGFDPIASLFIAILIAASVIPLVMDTGKVLALDVAERDVDIEQALTEVFPFLIYIYIRETFLKFPSHKVVFRSRCCILFLSAILAQRLIESDWIDPYTTSTFTLFVRPYWTTFQSTDNILQSRSCYRAR